MLKFLATIFGTSGGTRFAGAPPVRKTHGPRVRLGMEELTPRIVPSAGCGSASSSSASAAQSARALFSTATAGATRFADAADAGHHCGAEHAGLAASLTNSSGATGTATFSDVNGTLSVSVKGAAANTSLNVTVTDNGTTT